MRSHKEACKYKAEFVTNYTFCQWTQARGLKGQKASKGGIFRCVWLQSNQAGPAPTGKFTWIKAVLHLSPSWGLQLSVRAQQVLPGCTSRRCVHFFPNELLLSSTPELPTACTASVQPGPQPESRRQPASDRDRAAVMDWVLEGPTSSLPQPQITL